MCRQLLPQVNSSLYPFSTLLHASGTIAWRNCKHKSIWTGISPTADSSCWGPGIGKVCCLMWLPPSTHPTKTCCQQHKKSGHSLSFTETLGLMLLTYLLNPLKISTSEKVLRQWVDRCNVIILKQKQRHDEYRNSNLTQNPDKWFQSPTFTRNVANCKIILRKKLNETPYTS